MKDTRQDKKIKKGMSIRINPDVQKEFNDKLTTIYHNKKHRKTSAIIQQLLEQFNKQDNQQLEKYIRQDSDLINLNQDTIKDYQNKLQEKDVTIENLNQQLKEKDDRIQEQKDMMAKQEKVSNDKYNEKIESMETMHEQKIQELNKTIKDQQAIIEDNKTRYENVRTAFNESYQKEMQLLSEKVDDKTDEVKTLKREQEIIKQENQKMVDTLTAQIDRLEKEKNKMENNYAHEKALREKVQEKYNNIQDERIEYVSTLREVKKMSLIERIFNKYPNSVLALTENKDK